MISKSRFNALKDINEIRFYNKDGELTDKRSEVVYVSCTYIQYGDYGNSCLCERSNVAAIQEHIEENKESGYVYQKKHGYYGFTQLLMGVMGTQYTDTLEILSALEGYPLYNEEHHSRLKWETMEQAWKDDAAADFIKALGLNPNAWEDIDTLKVWLELADEHNINGGYGFHNDVGDSIHFHIKEMCEHIDEDGFIEAYLADELERSCALDITKLPFVQLECISV
jgi:hypothetical protein